MITISNADGTGDIALTRVDHVTDAESAAQALWESVHKASHTYGGTVHLIHEGNGVAVQWNNGPAQWAAGYVVSEGADSLEFVAQAMNADTVLFCNTD